MPGDLVTTPSDEPRTVWVISDLMPDRVTYMPVVHYGDTILGLPGDAAIAYAIAVTRAAEAAAYEEAICAQLNGPLKGKMELIAVVIQDLRKDRPSIDAAATAPLGFEPFVTASSHEGAIYLSVNGQRVGQWTVDDARQHAAHVLQVYCGVDLDAAYRRHLVGVLNLPSQTALGMVDNLRNHRGGHTVYHPKETP